MQILHKSYQTKGGINIKRKKNILDLYNIYGITNSGDIVFRDLTKVSVYHVNLLPLLDASEEYLEGLYNRYIACVQAIKCDIQILMIEEELSIQSLILQYERYKQTLTNSLAIKAVSEYMEMLLGLNNSEIQGQKQCYIATQENEETMQLIFEELKEYEIVINKIEDANQIERIIRKCIYGGK